METPKTENPNSEALAPVESKPLANATMWNDAGLMNKAWRTAAMLCKSQLVPVDYQGKPENCLIAIDIANRIGMSPLTVMQNLYIVKGRPAWSGQFCVAAINGCGKFTPIDYVFVEDGGGGCYVKCTRKADGVTCTSVTITMQMAKDEGWIDKNGSKWLTMPEQMMKYRAAAFFARTYCPEILLGIQTIDEVNDVCGEDKPKQEKITLTLEEPDNAE